MADAFRHLSATVKEDALDLLLGAWVGNGCARAVYEYAPDPENYVVKLETKARSFQNVAEYELWNRVVNTSMAKWFAPVSKISVCGIALVMRRTIPVKCIADMPKRVPAVLCDLKIQNFGLMDGRVVAHDYGFTNATDAKGVVKCLCRKVTAHWWSAEA